MVKSLSVMGITDSDFPMSSITGRANLLLTTSIGGGVYAGIKKPPADASGLNMVIRKGFEPLSKQGSIVCTTCLLIPASRFVRIGFN